MATKLSPRLAEIVDALPLRRGMRVLEIGCGSGAAARAVAAAIGTGYVLGIDRSERAIALALRASASEVSQRRLDFRRAAAEDFELQTGEEPFDIAFAVRVGALDGRHPHQEQRVLGRVRAALRKNGRIFLDGGNPLQEVTL